MIVLGPSLSLVDKTLNSNLGLGSSLQQNRNCPAVSGFRFQLRRSEGKDRDGGQLPPLLLMARPHPPYTEYLQSLIIHNLSCWFSSSRVNFLFIYSFKMVNLNLNIAPDLLMVYTYLPPPAAAGPKGHKGPFHPPAPLLLLLPCGPCS